MLLKIALNCYAFIICISRFERLDWLLEERTDVSHHHPYPFLILLISNIFFKIYLYLDSFLKITQVLQTSSSIWDPIALALKIGSSMKSGHNLRMNATIGIGLKGYIYSIVHCYNRSFVDINGGDSIKSRTY